MADIVRGNFTNGLFALLKETFEGPAGSIYLDRDAGLFRTLDAVTADVASHVPYDAGQTIAAHCAHLAYYVRANHDSVLGRDQQLDWPSSWRLQQVGDREWKELKGRVRREYAALLKTLDGLETWSVQQVADAMAIVAHTAYHLGAIRHALKNLKAREDLWSAPSLVPSIPYTDVARAAAWLERVLGCRERTNARLSWSGGAIAWFDVGDSLFSISTPDGTWPRTASATAPCTMKVYVDDLDGHYERALAEGATIVSEPGEGFWGGRTYRIVDIEGHRWEISQRGRDLSADRWRLPPGVVRGVLIE